MRDGGDKRWTSALTWPFLARLISIDERLAAWAEQCTWRTALYEFVRFGVKQAWACLFGGAMLALIIATHLAYPRDAMLARYDFLVLAAIALQVLMLRLGLETWDEARIILVFHVVGTAMEVFKTAVGSWLYPEPSLLRLGGVPLFTGFMYAAVGSYLARVWRLFDFRFDRHPPLGALAILSVAIYVNFFTHHYTLDIRLLLFAVAAVLFGPSTVHFKVWRVHRRMPLLLGLVLVALFIWFAENLGTFAKAWVYPNQKDGWSLVSISKLGSWFLLMILSYTMVAWLNGPAARQGPLR
jgi:uncharacterized membrane protein YoaT (DUF817 family)